MRIVRYLDYNWEMKKNLKIDEEDVYKLLGENLRDEILLQINGLVLN